MANLEDWDRSVPRFELRHRLDLALEHGDVSVSQMAAELGVSRNTVGNYLAGRTTPARAVLVVWAIRCGVSLDWLQTGTIGGNGGGPDISPVTIRYAAAWGDACAA